MYNCQSHPTSSQVRNCGVHQAKSARSDRLHKSSSLGNGSSKGRRNSEPNCWKKMKHIHYKTHIQPLLHTKKAPDTMPIYSSHQFSSLHFSYQCISQSWHAYGIRKSASGRNMPSLQETMAMPGPSPLPPPSDLWCHFQWTRNQWRNVWSSVHNDGQCKKGSSSVCSRCS